MLNVEKILSENSANTLEHARIERRDAKIKHKEYKQIARFLRGALKELLKDPIIKNLQNYAATRHTFYAASESWERSALGLDEYASWELDGRKRYVALTGKGFCVREWGYDSEKNQSWDRAIRFGRKLLFLSLYHAAKAGTTPESMKAKLHAQAYEEAEKESKYSLESLRG